jgi:hypothetical protein
MTSKHTHTLLGYQAFGAACFLWLVVFGWVAFGTNIGTDMVFAVCAFFALVALGLPAVLGAAARRPRRQRLEQASGDRIQTRTGSLNWRQGAIQILLAPVALALGFTAIGVIDILVRHAA